MTFFNMLWEAICSFIAKYVAEPFKAIGIVDVFDILILSFVLFEIYRFFHTRRAGRVMFGLTVIVLFSVLAVYFDLRALSYVVRLFAGVAFFCLIVIFQPEFRDALERIGNLTVFNPRSNTLSKKKMGLAEEVANETADAVETMAASRTGALIVFEGMTKLGDYTQTGHVIDARVSSKLIRNVFYNGSPLHDGAMVIRDMRIYVANCVLPSSTRKNFNFGLMGTRHRAAVGVTEVSDALVIVVSEQTGRVSVAQNGKLMRDIDTPTLKDILMTYMAGNAYLRAKRATVQEEYFKMLEAVAATDAAKKDDRRAEETVGAQPDPVDAAEIDSSLETVEEAAPAKGTVKKSKRKEKGDA